MGGYLANFAVYTLAMVGLIFFALFTFKKFMCIDGVAKKGNMLKVEESMSIAPRKTVYVISAGKERFLIAGDADKTTLISKLDQDMKLCRVDREKAEGKEKLENIVDFDFPTSSTKKPVMKELARKLQMM